ncbi:MAG: hypothetical protein MK082_07530 [Phycisphaerales bacterium]|nr:hypothetical protein [Phycisphaerales bacterium]
MDFGKVCTGSSQAFQMAGDLWKSSLQRDMPGEGVMSHGLAGPSQPTCHECHRYPSLSCQPPHFPGHLAIGRLVVVAALSSNDEIDSVAGSRQADQLPNRSGTWPQEPTKTDAEPIPRSSSRPIPLIASRRPQEVGEALQTGSEPSDRVGPGPLLGAVDGCCAVWTAEWVSDINRDLDPDPGTPITSRPRVNRVQPEQIGTQTWSIQTCTINNNPRPQCLQEAYSAVHRPAPSKADHQMGDALVQSAQDHLTNRVGGR